MIYYKPKGSFDQVPVAELINFPDGTIGGSLRTDLIGLDFLELRWFYENDSELFLLRCVVDTIRSIDKDKQISLFMPYIPNARMDRVGSVHQLFTLKTFARIINEMNFYSVTVVDAHSDVSVALLDRCQNLKYASSSLIHAALVKTFKADAKVIKDTAVICYPDAGSAKRYDIPTLKSVVCNKHRDFNTGRIDKLELATTSELAGRTVFIVDDICSYGGTFHFAAKALREAGAKDVILVVTHCEDNILKGKLFDPNEEKLVSKVFTTNSIFKAEHPDIVVSKI